MKELKHLSPHRQAKRSQPTSSLSALGFAIALALAATMPLQCTAQQRLNISHQFPSSNGDVGDFRDRMARMFASEVERRSNGKLNFAIYPGSSLMKVNAQFSALRKGALALTVLPLAYGGGEVPELNIVAMPGLVTSYEQGARWKEAAIGQALQQLLSDKGVIIVSWVWQAGGAASRNTPFINPEHAKGQKVRGGSREMDLVVKAAGGSALSLPSNESYAAMQTGAVDVVTTTSTSLMSFRIDEVSKHLTFNQNGQSYWFQLVPILMSKSVYQQLSSEEQALIMNVGRDVEKFGARAAVADDRRIADVFRRRGAQVSELSPAAIEQWTAVARKSAWRDYAERSENCARLLALAEQVR